MNSCSTNCTARACLLFSSFVVIILFECDNVITTTAFSPALLKPCSNMNQIIRRRRVTKTSVGGGGGGPPPTRVDRSTIPINLFFQQREEQKVTSVEDSDKSKDGMKNKHVGTDGTSGVDVNEGYMGDLVKFLKSDGDELDTNNSIDSSDNWSNEDDDQSLGSIIASTTLVFAAVAAISINSLGISLPETSVIISTIQNFFADPNTALEGVVDKVESMGTLGFIYFGAAYTIAEILAIPAIPLTASAGYLFGVRDGTIVVLISASIAAAISFLIGRTFLRTYVEKALENYPDFKKIDRAIGEEGFKLMLLLRISPIFPFALSNYFYGATKIGFWAFFFGTMIGFTPGTIAYVYTGEIGKSLTIDAGSEPWYVYVGLLALFSGFLKIIADVATGVIQKIDDDSGETN